MKISEIFYSIQGEGQNTGDRAIFVRVFGCNLKCSWCDTKYSWEKKYEEEYSKQISNKNLAEKIFAIAKKYKCNKVIWTGGEPLMFQNYIRGIKNLLPPNIHFEVETNGSVYLLQEDLFKFINCSPKLENSGNNDEARKLRIFDKMKGKEKICYKFVVGDEKDVLDVNEFIKKNAIVGEKIYLMALGETKEEQLEKIKTISELALKYGYDFSARVHCLIWSNEKNK